MLPNRLTDYMTFLNHQIIAQEKLMECHHKADALLEVFLVSDLASHSSLTQHSYFWALSDILNHAKDINETLLAALQQFVILVEPPQKPPGGNNDGTVH